MSLVKMIPSLLVAALAIGMTTTPAQAHTTGAQAHVGASGVIITDVDLPDGLRLVNGVLKAPRGTVSGTIAGRPFTAGIVNLSVGLLPPANGMGECSILDLELGPIDLDLLGLHVDTSRICLSLTAMEGEGLLGDLLCGLAGGNLGLLDDLLDVLPGLMTESMAQAGPPPANAPDICDGDCEILDLAIGPVDLDLLGLNIHLDNCADGPVQVCISASEGQGLLGDLLCGLAGGGLLDLGLLEDLLGAILDGLPATGGLNLTNQQLDRLVGDVTKLLRDGKLTNNELSKLTKQIQKLVRKA